MIFNINYKITVKITGTVTLMVKLSVSWIDSNENPSTPTSNNSDDPLLHPEDFYNCWNNLPKILHHSS